MAGKGTLEELMRERIRATIEAIVDEELEAALGAARSQRVGSVRAGYRHGKRERTLTTSLGATTIAMPRARIEDDEGRRREWRSRMIPRYQRRTERVDEAILGVYLSGTNTRRLRGALSPRCCAARRCRRMRCRAWWGGCGKISQRGPAGSRRAEDPLSVSGRLVSAGADREKARARAGAGHAGRVRQRPTRGARPAAGRGRERASLAGRGARAGRAQSRVPRSWR